MLTAEGLQDRCALVLYGSETGNAQDVAEQIGELCERLHFDTTVTELDAMGLNDLLQATIVIFSISTTGQGDFPGNSRSFWRKLKSVRLKPGCLSALQFTSFGLGDSTYIQFNYAHRKLHNRIRQLGGQLIAERGESDEQNPEGIDGTLIPWIVELRQKLLDRYPLPDSHSPIPNDVFLAPRWEISIAETEPNTKGIEDENIECIRAEPVTNGHTPVNNPISYDQNGSTLSTNESILKNGIFTATLLRNTRVTPVSHWQDVRLLEFSTPFMDYKPGATLTIRPQNNPSAVEEFLAIMRWTSLADKPIVFTPSTTSKDAQLNNKQRTRAIPQYAPNLTLRGLISEHLDLNIIPRRSFFAQIAHFTNDEFQKQRLKEFTDPEYLDELFDYTTRPRRSILEVLQEFDTIRIPLKWIASVIPAIRGRQFSIASGGALKVAPSSALDGNIPSDSVGRIQLLVAIVRYRTVIKKIREGLCSRYLAALQPGTKLNVVLCKGAMKLAYDRPAIMIGPGTGVAPLRAMIYENASLATRAAHEGRPTAQLLFFGGRNKDKDYFFEQEWSDLKDKTPLEVFTAFSRDQASKQYVQDILRKNAKIVMEAVRAQGVIYLCGSSGKMPQAIRDAFIEILQHEGLLELSAAEAEFALMEKSGRYQQETW